MDINHWTTALSMHPQFMQHVFKNNYAGINFIALQTSDYVRNVLKLIIILGFAYTDWQTLYMIYLMYSGNNVWETACVLTLRSAYKYLTKVDRIYNGNNT